MTQQKKPTPALAISGLKKTYPNGLVALKGIDLQVEQGDFFALLGPNGAGKSTTIGIICSLVQKTAGTVTMFGYDIDTDFSNAKQQIGIVPQEFNFNQFEKVLDVVVYQAGYYGVRRKVALERAEHYLKMLGLWDKRNTISRALSGRMKRRLMVVRALIHEPRLLILDEPTAGVDIEMRRSLWDFLQTINRQGTTIILTTHYLEEAEQLCRNIAIIDRGDIVQYSSMKALWRQLNKEVFVFDVEQVPKSLKLPKFNHTVADDHTIEVEVDQSQSINALFTQLSDAGIQVKSMRNKTSRLEELFMSLVEKAE